MSEESAQAEVWIQERIRERKVGADGALANQSLSAVLEGTTGESLEYIKAQIYWRTLSKSQKAIVAAKLFPSIQEEVQEKRREKLRQWAKNKEGWERETKEIRAAKIAADLVGVNCRYVQDALSLQSRDEEAFESVLRGEISLRKAMGF